MTGPNPVFPSGARRCPKANRWSVRGSTGSPSGRHFSIRIFLTPRTSQKSRRCFLTAFSPAGVPIILPVKARSHLEAAAILHDVGRAEGSHNHQKKSYRLIREKIPPPGWTAAEMEIVASIARYHRGALPDSGSEKLGGNSCRTKRKCFVSGRDSAARNGAGQRRQFGDCGRSKWKAGEEPAGSLDYARQRIFSEKNLWLRGWRPRAICWKVFCTGRS